MKEKLQAEDYNEILIKKIKEKVIETKKNAPDLRLIEKLYSEGREDEITTFLENGVFRIETLLEFKLFMENLGMPKEDIQDFLAHENAHSNKAESLGAEHLGYKINLIRNGNGYIFKPSSDIYIPDEWSEEKINDTYKLIAQAPEEYGNRLSPDDIEILKKLK